MCLYGNVINFEQNFHLFLRSPFIDMNIFLFSEEMILKMIVENQMTEVNCDKMISLQ